MIITLKFLIVMPAVIRHAPSDGRAFTNYLSNCEFERSLQQNFRVSSETKYRHELQKNAKQYADRSKEYVDFLPYHGINQCPKAAEAHSSIVSSLSRRR